MFRKHIIVLLALVVGIMLGFLGFRAYALSNVRYVIEGSKIKEIRATGYKYISPLLECEFTEASGSLNGLDPLQDKVSEYISEKESSDILTDASVYFRDLNNGPWFGIDEHANFSPASLLKLPVMMAYFKEAEKNPNLLSQKVEIPKTLEILEQKFSTPTIRANRIYTVEELIERMIQYSDNGSLAILEGIIPNEKIDRVTLDLGVETAKSDTPEDFMSVKGYAGLFRILYNASYLTKDYSNRALGILSNSQFKNGISKGVPAKITVAHKYGERQLADDIVQLHDCGIVYYPGHPYLLCIMTRGKDYSQLAGVINEISSMIYKDLDYKYKSN